jgi:hypothetical protein
MDGNPPVDPAAFGQHEDKKVATSSHVRWRRRLREGPAGAACRKPGYFTAKPHGLAGMEAELTWAGAAPKLIALLNRQHFQTLMARLQAISPSASLSSVRQPGSPERSAA